ncbi:hypothetical protein [Streptomyces sp. NPDC020965]|uniref:hypothetical protein n=1 Tax=Streptomyces sp. NPDC020965 TaxID=3365105 RepID=UPI0037A51F8C
MNRLPEPRRAYHCDVIAEGAVYGTGEPAVYVLATTSELSPRRALLWICGQARRIADRLDPDPRSSPWARPVTGTDYGNRSDGPTGLRAWADDIGGHRAVRDQLKTGAPVSFTVDDGVNGTFRLAIWPMTVRPDPAPEIRADRPLRVRAYTDIPHPERY